MAHMIIPSSQTSIPVILPAVVGNRTSIPLVNTFIELPLGLLYPQPLSETDRMKF
jgi:hypothetical protein